MTVSVNEPQPDGDAGVDRPIGKPGDPAGSRRIEGLRVLVVDDVRDNAIALAQVLELMGARVSIAYSAGDAIHIAANDRFDVFICDIVMPDMDGYRMLRHLRVAGLNSRTPAIAHTGHGGPEVVDAAMAAGYGRVLTKPSGLDAFVEAIRTLCER